MRVLMGRIFRMLTQTEQALYWPQIAELILNDGFNEKEAERVRSHIASDYYGTEQRAEWRTTQAAESAGE